MAEKQNNPTLDALQRYNQDYEEVGHGIQDFFAMQAAGEEPDPAAFARLLEAQSIIKSAMQAQFNLLQKPLKVVLNESKG
ncbi:MAG TPA: hypothetical protein VIM12_13735 [Noviherbaspirillum sp.]|jgi:hypothetical protein|uniref:hypothetical protein n=1 Tax=Noviherbaspirillum sp. TaxID=1926288 RepID=UPI002F926CFF